MTEQELQYCSQAFRAGHLAGVEGKPDEAFLRECWFDRVSDKDRSEYWWGFHTGRKNQKNKTGTKNSQKSS